MPNIYMATKNPTDFVLRLLCESLWHSLCAARLQHFKAKAEAEGQWLLV